MEYKYAVFYTLDNYYLYDGVSSNIFSITQSLYENHKYIFQNTFNGTKHCDLKFSEEYLQIKEAIDNNLLLHQNKTPLEYWFDTKEYKENFEDIISHLMIGITENCNMRCKYCVYGGDFYNERVHSEENIDLSTLKNTLDMFFSLTQNGRRVISFYGGEPFMNFDLIQFAVEHINSVDSNTRIYFTTNGTLLNLRVCEWFSANKNIRLYVSLGGTPEIHDKLRVFADDSPTYEDIRANLLYLKNIDFEGYKNRIHFIFNIFTEFQILELQEFWDNADIFKDIINYPEITVITQVENECENYRLGKKIINDYEMKYPVNLLDLYIEMLESKRFDNLLVKHFDGIFLQIHRRTDMINAIIGGVCNPFIKKIFVDTKGGIHICENFSYGNCFGNVNDKPMLGKSVQLLETYKNERNKTCRLCWATKLCTLCYRDLIDRNGNVNTNRAKSKCDNEKTYLTQTLSDYCYVLEHDADLLNHLNDYEIY